MISSARRTYKPYISMNSAAVRNAPRAYARRLTELLAVAAVHTGRFLIWPIRATIGSAAFSPRGWWIPPQRTQSVSGSEILFARTRYWMAAPYEREEALQDAVLGLREPNWRLPPDITFHGLLSRVLDNPELDARIKESGWTESSLQQEIISRMPEVTTRISIAIEAMSVTKAAVEEKLDSAYRISKRIVTEEFAPPTFFAFASALSLIFLVLALLGLFGGLVVSVSSDRYFLGIGNSLLQAVVICGGGYAVLSINALVLRQIRRSASRSTVQRFDDLHREFVGVRATVSSVLHAYRNEREQLASGIITDCILPPLRDHLLTRVARSAFEKSDGHSLSLFTPPTREDAVPAIAREGSVVEDSTRLVFLCHGSEDKERVRALSSQLRSGGLDPWLDEEKLLPGQDWAREIRLAIKVAHAVVVCLSRSSISKTGFVQKEIRFALDLAEERPDGTIFIIPALLEAVEVPERLQRWHWVDLTTPEGITRLVSSLKSPPPIR